MTCGSPSPSYSMSVHELVGNAWMGGSGESPSASVARCPPRRRRRRRRSPPWRAPTRPRGARAAPLSCFVSPQKSSSRSRRLRALTPTAAVRRNSHSAAGTLSHAGKRGRKRSKREQKASGAVPSPARRSRPGSTAGRCRSAAHGSARCRGAPPARQRAGLRERLIEAVWGAERPNTIGAASNVHLSKIRKLLAAVGVEATLVTERHGYALRVDSERLDLHCFEKSIRRDEGAVGGQGRGGGCGADRALALGGGRRLRTSVRASVDGALARFGELRLAALEDRFEAGLQLGRHAELRPGDRGASYASIAGRAHQRTADDRALSRRRPGGGPAGLP